MHSRPGVDLFYKNVDLITLNDIQNLPLKKMEEQRMQVAAVVVVAQVLRNMFRLEHMQTLKSERQVSDPLQLGTRKAAMLNPGSAQSII